MGPCPPPPTSKCLDFCQYAKKSTWSANTLPETNIAPGIWRLKPTFLLLPCLFSGSMLDSGSVHDKHGSDSTPFISGIKIRTNSAAVFEAGNFRTTLKNPGKTAQFRTETWNFGSPVLLGWSSDKYHCHIRLYLGNLAPFQRKTNELTCPIKGGTIVVHFFPGHPTAP